MRPMDGRARTSVLAVAAILVAAGCGATGPERAPRARPRSLVPVVATDRPLEGLHVRTWRPAGEASRGALLIVHGLRDHSARYERFAEKAALRGFAVHAFDLRGHGRSAGERVWVESFDEYVADLAKVAARVPERPLFIFGHSMGGAIVTLFALERPAEAAGMILSAPALKPGDDVSGFLIALTRLLGAAFPRLPVLALEPALFSRDPEVVLDNESEDPLIERGAGPARTAAELLGALERIGARMAELEAPVLILHGTADRITNPDGSRELHARARSTDKTLALYEGFYHASSTSRGRRASRGTCFGGSRRGGSARRRTDGRRAATRLRGPRMRRAGRARPCRRARRGPSPRPPPRRGSSWKRVTTSAPARRCPARRPAVRPGRSAGGAGPRR